MPDTAAKKLTNLAPEQPRDLIGGHMRSFFRDRTGFLTRQAKLGDVSYVQMGNQPLYFANHPDLVRDVLVVNADKFIKGRALQRTKSLLGNGLLTNEGASHLRQRRMIQPAFHRTRIVEYSRSMVEAAGRMADTWQDGEVRDIDRDMMRLTLQIVAKTLFGADVTDEADRVGHAMTTLVEMFNYLLLPFSEFLEKLPLPHSIRLKRARRTLDEIVYGFIDERRRTGEDRGDLLSMLLNARDEEDGSAMTDEEVRDEVLTLFLAGHETTANALTWTWMLLSQNPEAETKLHREFESVLGGRLPAMDDIPQLTFTEAVIAESMRLYPPAWAIGRKAIAEHELGGYPIAANAVVLVSPFVMHRDARFWDEPLEFRPERWLSLSVKEAGQRNIYFPFGGGVRRCIGEAFAWTELILLTATIGSRWKLRLEPDQKIGLDPKITLRPKFGMRMRIKRA
ncbi:MAG: cytochrome P450 [Pyrinomonadaceae bacterium]